MVRTAVVKRLFAALGIFLALTLVAIFPPHPALAAVGIVQQCSGQGSATTVTATCGSTTSSGSVLVALVRSNASVAITVPTNWTSLATNHATTYGAYLLCMAKVSVVGTGTTYTFTVDTGAVPNAVQMYELSGADLNLALFVNHAAKTQTTASGSWTGIGTAAGSMVPAGYQALAFISGITTPTSGGTITPTFTGTYTTDSEVSGLNNCWIQPYHSTAPITVNTAVGLTAATIITPNAGMAINVLYGAASSGFMVNRQVSVDDTSTSRSPTFSQVGGAIVTGNLTVAQVQWAATSLVTFTTPANWTIIDNQPPIQTSNTPGVATLYCVATASVCTNVTTTWTNAFSAVTSYNIYAVEFFGQNTTTPIDGHSYVQTTSSAPLTLPTVTPVISGDTAVSMASDATASNAAPSGFTAFFLNNVQNGGSIAYNVGGAYKTGLTTSGISPNWDTSSVASSAADLVVVAPVSTPPPSSCASYIALVGVGC